MVGFDTKEIQSFMRSAKGWAHVYCPWLCDASKEMDDVESLLYFLCQGAMFGLKYLSASQEQIELRYFLGAFEAVPISSVSCLSVDRPS